jgi:hypothetical protein
MPMPDNADVGRPSPVGVRLSARLTPYPLSVHSCTGARWEERLIHADVSMLYFCRDNWDQHRRPVGTSQARQRDTPV